MHCQTCEENSYIHDYHQVWFCDDPEPKFLTLSVKWAVFDSPCSGCNQEYSDFSFLIYGSNFFYPCDLIPFTRRPLFLVIDSDSCKAFKASGNASISELFGTWRLCFRFCLPHKWKPIHLFSNSSFASFPSLSWIFSPRHRNSVDIFNKGEKILSSSLNNWGLTLAAADKLRSAWTQVLGDPFLRRLLLRLIFCQAVLTLYAPTFNKKEHIPECMPALPESVLPTTAASQMAVMQRASVFNATDRFIFSKGIVLPET